MTEEATGRRGSWFARLPDGVELPCVHSHWMTGTAYDDPFAEPGTPVWDEFISAIAEGKRVILTRDEVVTPATTTTPPGFRRIAYVAVFGVEDVRVENRHLRFRFVRRLQDLK